MTDILVLEPNVYYRTAKQYSRLGNGTFTHRTPIFLFQVYSPSGFYSIVTKERKSLDDDWSPVTRLLIPKDEVI
jgi:hypothetical protein